MGYKTIKFTNVRGIMVPHQPWPQVFYMPMEWLRDGVVEVRPLTLRGLASGLVRNWLVMGYWRIMHGLWWLGFLDACEGDVLRWRSFSLHPLRTRRERAWGWHVCPWCGGDGYDPEVGDAGERLAIADAAPIHSPAGCPAWFECSRCSGLGIVPPVEGGA